jgi:predicted nuclease with TOPRIM domain
MASRIEELKSELEKGRERLESLERERQSIRDTMLRISGAIQVLEELKARESVTIPQVELAVTNP